MENEKVQNQQLKKMLSAHNSRKYSEYAYSDVNKLIVFKNAAPLRKKCFHCDADTFSRFNDAILI